MKLKISIPTIITLALASLNGKISLAQPTQIAQIIEVSGNVQLLRRDSSSPGLANNNELLYLGDILQVETGGKVVIRCTATSKTWSLPAGRPWGVANFCPLQ